MSRSSAEQSTKKQTGSIHLQLSPQNIEECKSYTYTDAVVTENPWKDDTDNEMSAGLKCKEGKYKLLQQKGVVAKDHGNGELHIRLHRRKVGFYNKEYSEF